MAAVRNPCGRHAPSMRNGCRIFAVRVSDFLRSGVSDRDEIFSLLADGIKDIQEKLVPRSRMDDLENEVKFLKLMCRQMAEDIAKLKKAN